MFGPQGAILFSGNIDTFLEQGQQNTCPDVNIRLKSSVLYVTWQLSNCYVEFFIWHDMKVNGQRHALDSFFPHKEGLLGSPSQSCVYVSASLLNYRYTCWALRVGHPVVKHCATPTLALLCFDIP